MCENCEQLEWDLLDTRRECDEARKQAGEATALMVTGEEVRSNLLFEAILTGAFTNRR